MARSKTVTWVAGTLFVSFVIVAVAWLFGISPLMVETTEMREQTESEESRIDQLEITLAGLERDAEHLDEFHAQVETLRIGIPATFEFTDLTRRLDALAAETGVVITSLGTNTATDVTPAVAEEPVPTTTAEETTAAAEAAADPAAPGATTEPPVPAVTQALYAIPVEIATVGGYDQTVAFMARLQDMDSRLILVSRVQATALAETGAQGGLPAFLDGFVEGRIAAWVFVLTDPAAAAVPTDGTDPEDTEEVLPVPNGQKNPFVPLS